MRGRQLLQVCRGLLWPCEQTQSRRGIQKWAFHRLSTMLGYTVTKCWPDQGIETVRSQRRTNSERPGHVLPQGVPAPIFLTQVPGRWRRLCSSSAERYCSKQKRSSTPAGLDDHGRRRASPPAQSGNRGGQVQSTPTANHGDCGRR